MSGKSSPSTQIDIEELPIISAAVISAFTAWAEARWPIPEKAKSNGDGRTNEGKADFRNTCLREDVEAALKALPCDYDRETWVKLGMAYRAGGGSYAVFLRLVAPASGIPVRQLCPRAVAVFREHAFRHRGDALRRGLSSLSRLEETE